MQIGPVKIINANETVSNMTEPLTADLLNAWLTDADPSRLFLYFAIINFSIIKKLIVSIEDNGMKEYKKESIWL